MTVERDDVLEWFAHLDGTFRVERRNGVPVVHVGAPGAIRAGLMFRVGSADERLPERGLTHLVEHLAMHGQASPTDHRNGMTGATITQFVVSGSEQQVVAFLNHICEALRDLPVERLDAERSILGVEAQHRQASISDDLLRVRYGALGLARGTFREFGAEVATADDVLAWAKRWFVRGNVVAWMTTDTLPDGLDLRLPEGELRVQVPPPGPLITRPAWFRGSEGVALVDAVVDRSAAATMFADVLTKVLFRRLRLDRGYSYTAVAQYEPLDADRARIFVVADAATDATAEMVGALADALADLRDGRFDPRDVADAREQGRESARRLADSPDFFLEAATVGFLLGGEPWNPQEVSARREAVTDADLAAVARAFWDDAIWQVPSAPDSAGEVVEVPKRTALVDGLAYFHAGTHERFVLGEEGVSMVSGGEMSTVLFRDCVLAVQWGDGLRVLVGSDGAVLSVETSALRLFGEQELARLDAAVLAETVVRLPARAADAIPQMPPLESSAPPRRGLGVLALVAAAPVLFASVLSLIVAVSRTLAIGQLDQYGEPITAASARSAWALGVVLLVGACTLVWAGVRRLRQARGRR